MAISILRSTIIRLPLAGLLLLAFVWPVAAWGEQATSQPASAPHGAVQRRDMGDGVALKSRVAQLEAKVKQLESAQEVGEGDDGGAFSRKLAIYGFFDLTLHKFFPEEGTLFEGVVQDELSFLMNRINVYIDSRMTETLRALIELRFTFAPLGNVTMYGIPFLGVPFNRQDTTVLNTFNANQFRLGGLVVERAHMTYQPIGWFGIRAGRYLTPFGIWNVDHGSPVIIPVRQPYATLAGGVPLAQTGVQLLGKFHLSTRNALRYVATISNGRGPTESVYDLDNNKALGLKLRWTFEGDDLFVGVGNYIYWGSYRDAATNIAFLGIPPRFEETEIDRFSELLTAADLMVKFAGIQWQSELVWGRQSFDIRAGAHSELEVEQMKFYTLLAYQLPLARWLGEMRLRLYFMFEYGTMDDGGIQVTAIYQHGTSFVGGVNFQPVHWVTIKWEAWWAKLLKEELRKPRIWATSAQVAVAF